MTVDIMVAQRKATHRGLESPFSRNIMWVDSLWKLLDKMYLYIFLSKR